MNILKEQEMITIANRNKLSLTRPKYSLGLMGGSYEDLTMSSMRKTLVDSNEVCHIAYSALMDADIQEEDVVRIHTDGESVAVTLRSAKLAKSVKEMCNKEYFRYGAHFYRAHIKARDKIVIVETEELETEDVDED